MSDEDAAKRAEEAAKRAEEAAKHAAEEAARIEKAVAASGSEGRNAASGGPAGKDKGDYDDGV
ncbi:hypothetical protein ACO229_22810 [Promicromonospora sp. MS192]|uniref:hypothetical protein n=1 Tax=Promicromonospora sp. MS192 TaxID=3412684 RepID=UPI003C2D9468